jgi:UDP-glucose 4-epimerase
MDQREVVLITGSSGRIATAIINRLAERYQIVGLDQPGPPFPPEPAHCIEMDIKSQESISRALKQVRERVGGRIASVIHLAGY